MQASPTCLIRLVVLLAGSFVTSVGLCQPESGDVTTAARVTVRGSEVREFDWAKLQARARIAYTSSGPKTLRSRMIDDDLQTQFQFSESDETPMVVLELSQSAQLHRVSTVFKAEDTRVDVILLNKLPKDVADLRFAKADASVVSLPDERGKVSVNFSVSSARYVAFRWKRNRRDEPFTVAEVSAFSNDPTDFISDQQLHLADNGTFTVSGPPTIGVISP
jgi:hypothetical protein